VAEVEEGKDIPHHFVPIDKAPPLPEPPKPEEPKALSQMRPKPLPQTGMGAGIEPPEDAVEAIKKKKK